ncbi:putative ATP-dependent carboligase, ATP-grasp superfamily [Candidatus Methanophagaceae archaeon]|nr:putative ATP-dependent carboligase, ATP-grasp superfamily [Methanophagales archaeon]
MDFGSASTFVESVYISELVELGTCLLKALNYYGLSEVEFKKDIRDDKFKLLEINARTWLWHSLAIRCGVDFPYLLYKDMIGEHVEPITSFKENVKFIHFYTDLGVVINEVLKGKMAFKDYFISLKGEKDFAVFSLVDPLPFIAETLMLPYLWKTR